MPVKKVRDHYMDASALVKLAVDTPDEEHGRAVLRDYYWNNANMLATSHSLTEALAVIKGKRKSGKLTPDQYWETVDRFIMHTIGARLRVRDDEELVPLLSPTVLGEANRLIFAYGIDFLDAFQLIVLRHGSSQHMIYNSQTLLINADRELTKAARAEGLAAWCCLDEPSPPLVKEPWGDDT